MKRFLFFTLLMLVSEPAFAQKPIFLVPGGGSSGPPTNNTVALGSGLSFASIPRAFIPTSASLQYSTPFSFSLDVKTSALNSTNFEFFYSSDNETIPSGWGIFDNGQFSNMIGFRNSPTGNLCPPGNSLACGSRSLINDGNLHTLSGSNDGTNVKLYIDTVLVDIEPTGTFVASTLPNLLGANNFAMTLYDVRLYSCALTAAQVTTLAQLAQIALRPTTGNSLNSCLIAEWPLSVGTYTLPVGTTSGSITDIIAGNTGILDTTPPTTAVTVPSNGATGLSGNLTVTATASDNTEVTQVQLLVDGKVIATLTSGPYTATWNSTLLVDGAHTFQSIATDFAGNTTTSATITASTSNGIAANAVLHFDTTGSNANGPACLLATPCQTIAYLNTLTLYPTWSVVFQGGQSFSGCLQITPTQIPSLGQVSHLLTYDSYGTGTATILANCAGTGKTDAVVYHDAISGVKIQNLSINANAAGSNTLVAGISAENTIAGNVMDTNTYNNLDITGFTSGTTTIESSGIFAVGFSSNGQCNLVTNTNITNNTIHGHTNSPNDAEGTGYSGYACLNAGPPVNSSLENMTFTGNLVSYMGGTTVFPGIGNGLVPNGVFTVLMQFNIAHDIAGNQTTSCGGGAGLWVNNSDSTVNKFSEAYNIQAFPTKPVPTGCDWGAAEFDNGTTNSTIEYFYSHHNAGPGFFGTTNGLDARGWGNNTTRYTVSESDNAYIDDGNGVYAFGSSSLPWYAYNNVAWTPTASQSTTSSTVCWSYAFNSTPYNPASVVPANSICIANNHDQFGRINFLDSDNAANIGSATLDYNLYYNPGDPTGVATGYRWYSGTFYMTLAAFQAASGKEAHAIAATDPLLTSAGAGQTCSWTPKTQATWPPAACPTGYVLSTTASAAIGSGVDLSASPYSLSIGTRDYYANTIPSGHGTGYNRGADGGFP